MLEQIAGKAFAEAVAGAPEPAPIAIPTTLEGIESRISELETKLDELNQIYTAAVLMRPYAPGGVISWRIGIPSVSKTERQRSAVGYELTQLIDAYDRMVREQAGVLPDSNYIGDMTGTSYEDMAAQLAQSLVAPPAPTPVSMATLSTEEIGRALQTQHMPELPEEISIEDMYAILRESGYQEDEIQQVMAEIQGRVEDPVAFWEEWNRTVQEYKQGIAYMTQPMSRTTKMKVVALQPFLALGTAFEPYFRNVTRPLAGLLVYTTHMSLITVSLGEAIGLQEAFRAGVITEEELAARFQPTDTDFIRLYDEARQTHNWWYAAGVAFENWDVNWGAKLVLECAVDPINLIGFGIFTKLTRGIPIVGRMVGATERGFLYAGNLPFRAVRAGWSHMPEGIQQILRLRTQQQIAEMTATRASVHTFNYPQYALAKPANQILLSERQQVLVESLDIARAYPAAQGDAAEVGRSLLKVHDSYFSVEEFNTWQRRIGAARSTPTAGELDTATIIMETTVGSAGGAVLRHNEAALYMIGLLGGETTEQNMRIITELVTSRVDSAYNLAKLTITRAGSIEELQASVRFIARNYILSQIKSPVFAQRFRQGVAGAMLQKFESSFLNSWRMWADRRIVQPFARGYLIFGNYGFPNYAETWYKGGLAGGGWKLGVGSGHVEYFQKLYPLLNAPQDLALYRPRGIWKIVTGADPKAFRTEMLASVQGRRGLLERFIAPATVADLPILGRIPGLRRIPLGRLAVDVWGELGMNRYAYFLTERMRRHTLDMLPPGTSARILTTVRDTPIPEAYRLVAGGEDEFQRCILDYILSDPRLLRNLPTELTANRIARAKLAQEWEKFTEVPQAYKEMVLTQVESGHLFEAAVIPKAEAVAPEITTLIEGNILVLEKQRFRLPAGTRLQYLGRNKEGRAVFQPLIEGKGTMSLPKGWSDTRVLAEFGRRGPTPTEATRVVENINRYFAGAERMMNEEFLMSPEILSVKFRLIADAIAEQPVHNYPEMMRAVQATEVMASSFDEVTWYFRNIARKETQLMPPLERQAMIENYNRRLLEYHQQAGRAIEDSIQNIRLQIGKAGLSADDQARVLRLLELESRHWQLIAETRARQFAAERTLLERTPPALRDDEFWMQFRAAQEESWEGVQAFRQSTIGDRTLLSDQLSRATYPTPIDASGRNLTAGDLAHLWGTAPDNMAQGLFDLTYGVVLPKQVFVMYNTQRAERACAVVGRTAEQLGYTPDRIGRVYDDLLLSLRIDPTRPIPELAPKLMQLAEMRASTITAYMTHRLPEGAERELSHYINTVLRQLQDIPGFMQEGFAHTPAVRNVLKEAMDASRREYGIAFANYDPENLRAVDDIMRSIYPYWVYEKHRPAWLLRNFIQYPGMPLSLGKYSDYTDRGYIHIPGTSIEFNPFRGTIFGPVLTRLTMRDFPEYYDLFPGVSQTLDIMGRFGFYPGIQIQLPMTLFGTATSRERSNWGMLLPALHRSALDAIMAVAPTPVARTLRENIFPDYFRDYQIILAVNRRGGDGVYIYEKKRAGELLTDEENQIWEAAAREIALHGIYFEQMAMFRYRPQEMVDAWNASSQLIEERLGITVEQQEYLRKRGLRLGDYYVPIDPETRRLLNELEAFQTWSGVSLPLLPTATQEVVGRRNQYWDEVDRITTGYRQRQEELDRRFLTGEVGRDAWRRQTSELNSERVNAIDTLGQSDKYRDVPKTLDELIAYYEQQGVSIPSMHPERELLNLYYSLEVEEGWDEDSQSWAADWNKYYAQIDAMLAAMPENLRNQFIEDITASMTPLRRLYWDANRQYIRPYRNTFYLALVLYTPDEQSIVREWYKTDNLERREELQAYIRPDGTGIVSSFRTALRQIRQNMRLVDPQLDAWLYFFGITDTFKTNQAREIYYQFCSTYDKIP